MNGDSRKVIARVAARIRNADGLQNVEEAFARYANTRIHGDDEVAVVEKEKEEEEEDEAEGVGLGEKSRPRRLFDDLEAKWART